jgi:hypothetical protein
LPCSSSALSTDVNETASAIDSAASLASRLRAGLTGSYGPPIEQFAALPDIGPGAPALPGGASRFLNTQLDAINEAEQATVLLDASDSGTAVRELFGRFRDTLWQGAHTWVVAVDEAERASVLRPPTDVFFDVMLLIDPWVPDPPPPGPRSAHERARPGDPR